MKKLLLFILLIIPFPVFALEYPDLYSDKVIIYDITDDKVLYALNENEKASIASLTKIMTTITAIEKINNLEEEVIITSDMLNTVRWDASVAGLKENDKVTYKDLLYASILPSGADATNSLAILLSGNIPNFVEDMNNLKDKIGLSKTNFVNTTGLDIEGHYSTAEDIIKLLNYAFKNDLFKKIYTTKRYELENGLVVFSTVSKFYGNSSLDKIIGSKTGFTQNAGLCISVYFNSNGHEIFLVTLGAPTEIKNSHILDALNLIDFIDSNYKERIIIEKEKILKTIPVKDSKIKEINISSGLEITKYLPFDYDTNNITILYEGVEELSYKNKVGTKLGSIKYFYEEELIGEEEIFLKEEIKIDYIKLLNKYKFYLVGIIIFLFFLFKRKKILH